jgi:hypothetical protein
LAAIEAGDEPDTRGTLLSAECSECFALELCCMLSECGCESPDPDCDQCIEESCQPLVDACVGGQ